MEIINTRTGSTIASAVELANTRATRRRGLLGRDAMAADGALIISPCFMIHTAFMRFAIDVVFLGRNGDVVRVVPDLPPWRMAVAPRAHAVIELAAGSLSHNGLRLGDRVVLER